MTYAYLLAAILCEVAGTAALQASQQFTRPMAAAVTLIGYAAALYFLSLALRGMPIGVAYAIWSGLGVVLIALIGLMWFGQRLDFAALLGLAMIVAGVATINLFSQCAGH